MTSAPTSELVTVAWVGTATGLTTGQVATSLPGPDRNTDRLSWAGVGAGSGFIVVGPTVGGSPHPDIPRRSPVLQVSCYAAPGVRASGRPPWGRANELAELVVASTQPAQAHLVKRTLTLPSGYRSARVLSAYAVSEPRRVPGDAASFAVYQFDLHVDWVEL